MSATTGAGGVGLAAHDGAAARRQRAGGPAPGAGSRRRLLTRSLVLAALVGTLVVLVLVFVVASRAAYGGNSDDATLVLQGESVAHGNLTLSGWDLSYDAFWTSEVPLYALAVRLAGVRPGIMNVVPAVVAVLLVVAATCLALAGARARGGAAAGRGGDKTAAGDTSGAARRRSDLAAAGLVVALLALPNPVLAYFLLQGGWHAVTTLLCLVAFGGVVCSRRRSGVVVAVLALAAAFLGDLLSVVVAGLPLLAAGVVAAWRQRDRRASYRHLAAVGGGALVAIVGRLLALGAGTYSIGSRSILATASQAWSNLASVPDRVAGMFGVTGIVAGTAVTPWPLRAAQLVLLAGVVAAFAASLVTLVRAVLEPARRHRSVGAPRPAANPPEVGAAEVGRPPGALADSPWALDDLLALAVLAGVAAYAVFATDDAVALARYLVPGVVSAVVLAARVLRRLAARLAGALLRPALVAGAVLLACCCATFAAGAAGPPASQQARALAGFLASHHLGRGIGDYWSASIVTVDSADAVRVRPVELGPGNRLVRYTKQSSASWYAGVPFDFFVADAATPWHGVTPAAAERAFGNPARSYSVGPYRVLVWSQPLHVSP